MPTTERTTSIVVPVHNERESLPILWTELRAVLDELGRGVEVVFVDDGSTDGSDKELLRIVEADRRVRCVTVPRREGLTAAFDTGYRAATGQVIVTMDADLQSDPRDIPRLLAALQGADAAVGWRQQRRDRFAKRWQSR